MFQRLVAEMAVNLVLSLIPQRVRSVIGGLIMAVGALLLMLGLAIVIVISEDVAFFLGGCVGLVGVFITGIGWWIRSVEPFETVGESFASTVIDL
tara:strand:- start:736 stop:1020 length:285 start_codon:yes stop_codon:yes gene_type:complete